ncbi:MAG: CAP domain-containing protein [Xanthobacteraceae bacterium]|nr:CAP domain-containing protein [Xanthobacteraceae bacterium]
MFECLALLLQLHGCSPGVAAASEKSATLNEFRTGNGLTELRVDPKMVQLAKAHAEDMARREHMDHNGFFEKRGPAGARAENVLYGCATMTCTIQNWIKSPGHRSNMLLADVKTYGLASAKSKSGVEYWALELGSGK